MATARVYGTPRPCLEKKDGIAEERKMEEGSKRKKNADEDHRDSPHVSLPWSSECIYSSIDFKFLLILYFILESRHVIASIFLYDTDKRTQDYL